MKGKEKLFSADQFVATKWATAEDKASFANELARFVLDGCRSEKFTVRMYERLRTMFGHIAHYDFHGFKAEWFMTASRRSDWVAWVLYWNPRGDPMFTWSDVEKAFGRWLMSQGKLIEEFRQAGVDDVEASERAELARLQAKYGGV